MFTTARIPARNNYERCHGGKAHCRLPRPRAKNAGKVTVSTAYVHGFTAEIRGTLYGRLLDEICFPFKEACCTYLIRCLYTSVNSRYKLTLKLCD